MSKDGSSEPEHKFQECKPLNGLPSSRCLGGMHTESQPPCKDGFYGPLCGLCQPAWYLANGGCEPCDGYRSNSSGSDDLIGNGATGSGEQGSGNGDWGSGSGGARRLAEGNSNDGMFKIKAYTAATHRVNFSVWVRWGLILAASVSGLIIGCGPASENVS